MKKIFLAIFVLSLGSVFAQKNSKEKTRATISKVIHKKETNSAKTYSVAPCLIDSMVGRIYDTVYNKWQRDYKEVYAYDSQSNNSSIFYFNANASQSLTPSYSLTMNYNSQGTLTLTLMDALDPSTNTWNHAGQSTYTYNASGDKIKQLDQSWDASTSTWTNSSQTSYSYTPTHSVTIELGEFWTPSIWTVSYKSITSYNAASNPTLMFFCAWNLNTNSLDTLQKITYAYTGNQLSSVISYYWDQTNNIWADEFSYAYTYSNGNLVLEQEQTWINGGWSNTATYTMTYDSQNNLIQEVDVMIDPDSGDVTAQFMSNYYYKCNLVGIKEFLKPTRFNLYPNPAQSLLTMDSENSFEGCRIINLSGQSVFESQETVNSISVSHLEKGIYFIQLLDKNKSIVATEKFVKD